MFDARNVIQFAEFYPVGHRSTNYKKFFDTAEPYAIRFKSGYEPYVLVSRKHMPWYDERFRGYGWDKVRLRSDPAPAACCCSSLRLLRGTGLCRMHSSTHSCLMLTAPANSALAASGSLRSAASAQKLTAEPA